MGNHGKKEEVPGVAKALFRTLSVLFTALAEGDLSFFRRVVPRLERIGHYDGGELEEPCLSAAHVGGESVPEGVFDKDGVLHIVRRQGGRSCIGRVTTNGFELLSGSYYAVTHLYRTFQGDVAWVEVPTDHSYWTIRWGNIEWRLGAHMGDSDRFVCGETEDGDRTITVTYRKDRQHGHETHLLMVQFNEDGSVKGKPILCSRVRGLREINGKIFFVSSRNSGKDEINWGSDHHVFPARTVKVLEGTAVERDGVLHFLAEFNEESELVLKLCIFDGKNVETTRLDVNAHVIEVQRDGDHIFLIAPGEHDSSIRIISVYSLLHSTNSEEIKKAWQTIPKGETAIVTLDKYSFIAMLGREHLVQNYFGYTGRNSRTWNFWVPIGGLKVCGNDDAAILIVDENGGHGQLVFAKEAMFNHRDGHLRQIGRPLLAPFDRLQEVNGQLLSWHFRRGTVTVTRYRPRG